MMRVFVTGATGWVGSAVVRELIAAGHQVLGLCRSPAKAAELAAAGAEAVEGSLQDLQGLRRAAQSADGVIHLAFDHDFSRFAQNGADETVAIEALGASLEGSERPLVVASGVALLAPGTVSTERSPARPELAALPRNPEAALLRLRARGVRGAAVRLAPTVHGHGDHGFVPRIIALAREKGVSPYLGDGANRWPAVHRLDAAALVRRAIDSAAPGTVLHAVAEEGIATRDIATALGTAMGLPTAAVAPERAAEHFGWLGAFFGADVPASSAATRAAMDWAPRQPTLCDDIAAGHYPGD